jgi:MOSC domain-containing protein YiiM
MSSPVLTALLLHRIFVAAGHSYFGRHGRGSASHPIQEVNAAECVAGCGLRGDRFFGYKPDYKGQVTLFSREVFADMVKALNLGDASPAGLRRNLLVEGADLNELIGRQFELQGVLLEGMEECRPCYWMDEAFAPGTEAWLRDRGGLRCRILSDGWLRTLA